MSHGECSQGQGLGLKNQSWAWNHLPHPLVWQLMLAVRWGLAGVVSSTCTHGLAWASSAHGGWIPRTRVPKESQAEVILPPWLSQRSHAMSLPLSSCISQSSYRTCPGLRRGNWNSSFQWRSVNSCCKSSMCGGSAVFGKHHLPCLSHCV